MSFWNLAKSVFDLESKAAWASETLDQEVEDEALILVGSPAYNQSLRDVLREFGDTGQGVRKIKHIIAPPECDQDLSNLELRAELAAFDGWFEHDFERGSVIFLQSRDPNATDFDDETARIAAAIRSVGWDYAGIEIELAQDP